MAFFRDAIGENDDFVGSSGSDTIFAGGGTDYAFGQDGGDLIFGSSGNDTLDLLVADFSVSGGFSFSSFEAAGGQLFNAGTEQDAPLLNDRLRVGAFTYIEAVEISVARNSQARIDEDLAQVEIDRNGDGIANIFVAIEGMTAANQLTAADFRFV